MSLEFPFCCLLGSDQVRHDADGDADQRQGEGDRHRGVQEVAQIFFVEDGHCFCSLMGAAVFDDET